MKLSEIEDEVDQDDHLIEELSNIKGGIVGRPHTVTALDRASQKCVKKRKFSKYREIIESNIES